MCEKRSRHGKVIEFGHSQGSSASSRGVNGRTGATVPRRKETRTMAGAAGSFGDAHDDDDSRDQPIVER